MRIAIPQYKDEVAPCFDYTVTIVIYTVQKKKIVEQKDYTISSQWPVDRIRLLRDQHVDVLICGGIQDRFEDMVSANGIEVISWVSGKVEELLDQYLRHELQRDEKVQGTPQ